MSDRNPVRLAHPESALVIEVHPEVVDRYADQGWHPVLEEAPAPVEADTPLPDAD